MTDLDNLDDIEGTYTKRVYDEAFKDAFDKGKLDGESEGYLQGSSRGKVIGSELGFYRGYTKTWIELLKSQNNMPENWNHQKTSRILTKLEQILQLVESYPRSNETNCEQKLTNIRHEFKNLKHFDILDDYSCHLASQTKPDVI